jgi:2-aminoethylphosphonate-pyruvate transaminase
MKSITAILLAAGRGTRLGNITENCPKQLLVINGRPLIEYAIAFLKEIGVSEIVVCGGHFFDDVKRTVFGIDRRIKVYRNSDLDKNSLYALDYFPGGLKDSFLLMNTDHIYRKEIAGKIKSQLRDSIVAFTDYDRELFDDDMKVMTTDDGRFVVNISKQLSQFNRGYVGITYCPKNKIEIYKKAIEKTKERFGDKAVVENVLQVLADGGEEVVVGDISGSTWHEIDFPDELERAKKEIAMNSDFYF